MTKATATFPFNLPSLPTIAISDTPGIAAYAFLDFPHAKPVPRDVDDIVGCPRQRQAAYSYKNYISQLFVLNFSRNDLRDKP